MMENEHEVYRIMRNSFFQAVSQSGLSAEEFIQAISCSDESNKNLSIEEFIKKSYLSSIYHVNTVIRDVNNFCNTNAEKLSSVINWNIFLKKCFDNKIKASIENFNLENYFKKVPIIDLWDIDFNASIRYYNEFPDCVLTSKSLGSIIRYNISYLIAKFLFPYIEEYGELGFRKGLERGSWFTNEYFKSYGTDLITICICLTDEKLFYSGKIQKIQKKYSSNSNIYSVIASQIYEGIFNFTILHEIGHIILGHNPNEQNLDFEIEADIFAQNVNIWEESIWNKEILSMTSENICHIFYVLKAISPVILLNIFTVLKTINRGQENPSHPHPAIRKNYIHYINQQTCSSSDRALDKIQAYYIWINELFKFGCESYKLNFENLNVDIEKGNVNIYGMSNKFKTGANTGNRCTTPSNN